MKKLITGALAALTVGGAIASTAAPASAQPYRGGYYHGGRGVGVGTAVGAGILGLAVGAAIANHPYYGPGYGYAPGYAYGPGYYAPPPYYAYGYAPGYVYGPYRHFHHFYRGYYRGW